MKQTNKPFPKDAKLIIWDMDGALYPYDFAYTRVVVDAIKDISHIAVDEWGMARQESKGEKMKVAMEVVKSLLREGRNTDALIKKYNLRENGKLLTHGQLFDRFKHCIAEHIAEASPDLKEAMENHGLRQLVLTHSKTDLALQVLAKLGIVELFDEKHVFGKHRVENIQKDEGQEPFRLVLDAVNRDLPEPIRPEQVIIVDDKAKNLHHPREMGMFTVLLQFKSYVTKDPRHLVDKPIQKMVAHNKHFMKDVDRVFETPLEFLQAFDRSHEVPQPVERNDRSL